MEDKDSTYSHVIATIHPNMSALTVQLTNIRAQEMSVEVSDNKEIGQHSSGLDRILEERKQQAAETKTCQERRPVKMVVEGKRSAP